MQKGITVLRVVSVVLSSQIFFVASCTVGARAIGEGFAYWQALDDPKRYEQAVVTTRNGGLNYLDSRREIDRISRIIREHDSLEAGAKLEVGKTDDPYSFLLSESEGTIEINEYTFVHYQARAISPGKQDVTVR